MTGAHVATNHAHGTEHTDCCVVVADAASTLVWCSPFSVTAELALWRLDTQAHVGIADPSRPSCWAPGRPGGTCTRPSCPPAP